MSEKYPTKYLLLYHTTAFEPDRCIAVNQDSGSNNFLRTLGTLDVIPPFPCLLLNSLNRLRFMLRLN